MLGLHLSRGVRLSHLGGHDCRSDARLLHCTSATTFYASVSPRGNTQQSRPEVQNPSQDRRSRDRLHHHLPIGYLFEKQNVAFMVGLAFSVAASINFPVLVMSIFSKNTTTKGAVIGGLIGLVSSVTMVVLSKSVWEDVLGMPKGSAPFPYSNPALFSMTAAFVSIWFFSMLDRSATAAKEREAFEAQKVRSETGIGIALGFRHTRVMFSLKCVQTGLSSENLVQNRAGSGSSLCYL